MMSNISPFEFLVFKLHAIKINYVYIDKAKDWGVKEQVCVSVLKTYIVDVF